MSRHLVLSFRFLAPWFHGCGDENEPEWPPSPLRAFQAIVAAAARAGTLEATRNALRWLEERPLPDILARGSEESVTGYRLSVPHNAMDIVGRQWSRGGRGNAAEHRTMKSLRPRRLPEDAVVHYVWELDADESAVSTLITAARGVVALGWGVDLVVGNGAVIDAAQVPEFSAGAKVWVPRSDGRELRVPIKGTLDDLEQRHAAFLARTSLADPTLCPPPALSTFAIAGYAPTDQQRAADVAGFKLMRVDSDNLRAFDTARRGMAVAGMLRHALRTAAQHAGWDENRVNATVLGHGENSEPRLLLVPVPSIEPRGAAAEAVGAIRRVMIFSTNPQSRDVAWIRRALGGRDLVDEKTAEIQAVLAATSRNDRVFKRYLQASTTWATVTPMVLPGHDDPGGLRQKLRNTRSSDEQKMLLGRLLKRREALVRKALRHAGMSDELVFTANIDARDAAFIAGADRASRYAVPSHLKGSPRLHVKLAWPVKIAGPLCAGSGRFSGLGLFAAID